MQNQTISVPTEKGKTMTDRERLIDILEKAGYLSQYPGTMARILLENGVTFAKDTNVPGWIPVTERLPSDDVPSTMYLCFWNGIIRVCKYWRTRKCFELRGKTVKVTHWMPLPEPPKEGE